jgi:glutathione S-transferase
MFFAAGPLEAAVTARSLGLLAPEDKQGMAGYGTFDHVMDALEQAVGESEYICGDQFTAADVYVGSQIQWGLMFKSMPDRPAFIDYAARIGSRPAAARARALDDALIPKPD